MKLHILQAQMEDPAAAAAGGVPVRSEEGPGGGTALQSFIARSRILRDNPQLAAKFKGKLTPVARGNF